MMHEALPLPRMRAIYRVKREFMRGVAFSRLACEQIIPEIVNQTEHLNAARCHSTYYLGSGVTCANVAIGQSSSPVHRLYTAKFRLHVQAL